MLWVNGGILLATLLLVGVTYWYVRLTRASVRASEKMVGFESERKLAVESPKLVISGGDSEGHLYATNIVNTGSGPAREATLFVYVGHPEERDPVKVVQLPYEIPGGDAVKPKVRISQPHYLQAAIRIRLCHYTDRHSPPPTARASITRSASKSATPRHSREASPLIVPLRLTQTSPGTYGYAERVAARASSSYGRSLFTLSGVEGPPAPAACLPYEAFSLRSPRRRRPGEVG